MQQTMTRVGLDAHARSTHGAAIDVMTGELTRRRFGEGTEEVVDWLGSLPGPVHAVYEAGPTGFALYRSARAADHVLAISWRAQHLLNRLRSRGKPGNVATVAVARELSGFLWAAATAP